MVALILFLILIAILFGVGFASATLHLLIWIAIICAIIWLIGFAFRPRGGRWYYW
jgi:hypothetical protein